MRFLRNICEFTCFWKWIWCNSGVIWCKQWCKHHHFSPKSIELCACRNVRIQHQKVQSFCSINSMSCRDQHSFWVYPHHLSGRKIGDRNTCFSDQFFRFIVLMNSAYHWPRSLSSPPPVADRLSLYKLCRSLFRGHGAPTVTAQGFTLNSGNVSDGWTVQLSKCLGKVPLILPWELFPEKFDEKIKVFQKSALCTTESRLYVQELRRCPNSNA